MKAAWRTIAKRLLLLLPVLWIVVSLIFFLIHLVPGDPVEQMLGEGATASDIGALRHAYGLDVPLHTQYIRYWNGVLHGNLGQSLRFNRPVTELILSRYPYTLELAIPAIVLAILLSFPAGIASARHRSKWQDQTPGRRSVCLVFRFRASRWDRF